MIDIKNRRGYPASMKKAVVREAKIALRKNEETASSRLAAEYNVHHSTVCNWRRAAGVAQAQPAGLAKHQADMAAEKAFNTPTATVDGIMYRGVLYTK